MGFVWCRGFERVIRKPFGYERGSPSKGWTLREVNLMMGEVSALQLLPGQFFQLGHLCEMIGD